MNNLECMLMIEQFLDGELEKGKEKLLFERLAFDEECREYFRNINTLKNITMETKDDFPDELEFRIFNSIKKKEEKKKFKLLQGSWVSVFAYAFSFALLILCLYFYSEAREYKTQREILIQNIYNQDQEINELLFNTTPEVSITAKNIKQINRGT